MGPQIFGAAKIILLNFSIYYTTRLSTSVFRKWTQLPIRI